MKSPKNFQQFTVTINTDITVLMHGILNVMHRSFMLLKLLEHFFIASENSCYTSKHIIFSSAGLQVIYFDDLRSTNNFFRNFSYPLQKNNGPSLKTCIMCVFVCVCVWGGGGGGE